MKNQRPYDQLLEHLRNSMSMLTALRQEDVQMPYHVFRAHEHLAATLEQCQGAGGALAQMRNTIERLEQLTAVGKT